MNQTATTTSATGAASLTGHIMGGNQPVVGATVTLYAAGTTGYGSTPTAYASTTSANDAYGSFSFTKNSSNTGANPTGSTWGCPTSGDPQMYIVATGGNSQGNYGQSGATTNTAIGMIAAIGKCSTVSNSTFVNLNEVTSAATMAALQQYFNPNTLGFGLPSTTQGQLGFANAVATIANLADITTGTAKTSATPTSSLSGITVTATPEYAKLNTIADIVASCVNSTDASATNCATLFANTPAPSASVTSQPSISYPSTQTNVLQSLYYMLVNPTNGSTTALANLYALAPASAPFQPTLTAAPSDWTVGILYNTAGTCSIGYALYSPNNVAIDSQGNVYVNNSVTATPTLGVFSPTGGAMACVGDSTLTGTSYGLTIDPTDSAWMATYNSSAKMLQYKSGTATLWTEPATTMEGVVSDGSGNLFSWDYSGKLAYLYSGASTAATPTTPTQIASAGGTYGVAMATDGIGNTLVINATTTTSTSGPYLVAPSTATGAVNGYATTLLSTSSTPFNYTYSLAVKSSNTTANTSSFWIANYCASNCATTAASIANTLVPISFSGHTASIGTATAQCVGGVYRARGIAVDGAGNAWVSNFNLSTGSISEISASGTALSPAYNGTCTDTTTTTNIGGFQKALFVNYPKGIAIDPSGNVWTVQGTTQTSSTPAGIVEIVGAAVPAVTPISAALANSTVGVKP